MENRNAASPPKALTKTEVLTSLSETSDLSKQQVATLLDELAKLIQKNLQEGGPGVISIPGLMKINVVRKPATEERTGINPFTKEEMVFKAKPAKNVIKVVPLKALKDAVA